MGIKRKKEDKSEVREVLKNNNNTAQKKYLANRRQLRVWVEEDKFEEFKKTAVCNGTSMHRLINDYICSYLLEHKAEELKKSPKR